MLLVWLPRSSNPGPNHDQGTGGSGSTSLSADVFLSDLKPIKAVNWPIPPAPDGKKLPNFFTFISVNGNHSPHGIGMHPSFDGPARVAFSLGKQYNRFTADVSLNDTAKESHSPMIFSLYGDGKLLWKSDPLTTREQTQRCAVSIKGVDELELMVGAIGKAHGAHGVWIEPAVRK